MHPLAPNFVSRKSEKFILGFCNDPFDSGIANPGQEAFQNKSQSAPEPQLTSCSVKVMSIKLDNLAEVLRLSRPNARCRQKSAHDELLLRCLKEHAIITYKNELAQLKLLKGNGVRFTKFH